MSSKVYFQDGEEEIMIDVDLIRHACFGKDEGNAPLLTIWYGDGLQDGANLSFFGDIATRLWKVIKMISRKLPA